MCNCTECRCCRQERYDIAKELRDIAAENKAKRPAIGNNDARMVVSFNGSGVLMKAEAPILSVAPLPFSASHLAFSGWAAHLGDRPVTIFAGERIGEIMEADGWTAGFDVKVYLGGKDAWCLDLRECQLQEVYIDYRAKSSIITFHVTGRGSSYAY